MNRALSGRRRNSNANSGGGGHHRFSISTFRGLQQPQLSKKMNRVIKSENSAISAHESAARQRMSIASQISEWGETTNDDAISDISDKLGVLLAEMGEQEDVYAQNLEEYRTVLKHIRDTEGSVQPTRDHRSKLADDMEKLKLKDPESNKLETMQQELVRAEAQNLVAEAQLTNVTRQRFKEAYSVHLAAVIERGEKQALLARHARRLLNCLDDTSVIPGDEPEPYAHGDEAKQIVEDAERELHSWEGEWEPVEIKAVHGDRAVPTSTSQPSSSGRGDREAPATESLATESMRGDRDVDRTDTASVSDTYSHISANDAGSPERVHSISTPMVNSNALEERGNQNEGQAPNRNGVGEKQKVAGRDFTQHPNKPVSESDFANDDKKEETSRVGEALDSQVQRVAVPI
ncbi:Eisosome component PIL1-domain-containing protein [Aspergillus stella-maris]|uniref:Eisosome component PIL1-domain-containing protein n=1 Tax=Aspergillus stella-maris TaxID=1810926 RepID=UPI003CCD52A5